MNHCEHMKNLILINGAMGAGKTTVSRALQKILPDAVLLDGDWCWDADPFLVTEETKHMVMENITFLFAQFLDCSAYQNVIFCWVMHEQHILSEVLARLHTQNSRVLCVTLVQSEDVLRKRLMQDIARGLRDEDVIARSLSRLVGYAEMDTVKLDTSALSPDEAARRIAAMLEART